jgi:hypothetical protein
MTTKFDSSKCSIGNFPEFHLVRKDPKVGLLVVPDAKERSELQTMVENASNIVTALARHPNAIIQIEHLKVKASYLDRLAKLYARCEVVYLLRDSFWAIEPFFTKFWKSLTASEQGVTLGFTCILIAQGRLQLQQPSFMQQVTYAPANPGAMGPQRYAH